MSQLPALTTTFTPAPSCLSYLYALEIQPDLSVILGSPTDYSACFPSGWATNSASYFSPGLFCPSGYISACTSLLGLPAVSAGESTIICCPSGYKCNNGGNQWPCTSALSTATLDLYTDGSKSGSVTVQGYTANAFSVQIRNRASDISTASSSRSQTVGSSTGSVTGSITSSFTSPTTGSATSIVTKTPSPGLSTGAKAGIGVGVAIGVLALLLLLGALLLRRRRQRVEAKQTTSTDQVPYTKPELDGQNQRRDGPGSRPELDEAFARQELDPRSRVGVPRNPAELDATGRPTELMS